jgi:hypothetical protein
MTPHDLSELMREAETNTKVFEKLIGALEVFAADFELADYAHDRYLPAAHEYREYVRSGRSTKAASRRFREIRGRLGGTSKAMYRRQKETLFSLFRLLVPSLLHGPLTDYFLGMLWKRFLAAERNWLAANRRA